MIAQTKALVQVIDASLDESGPMIEAIVWQLAKETSCYHLTKMFISLASKCVWKRKEAANNEFNKSVWSSRSNTRYCLSAAFRSMPGSEVPDAACRSLTACLPFAKLLLEESLLRRREQVRDAKRGAITEVGIVTHLGNHPIVSFECPKEQERDGDVWEAPVGEKGAI